MSSICVHSGSIFIDAPRPGRRRSLLCQNAPQAPKMAQVAFPTIRLTSETMMTIELETASTSSPKPAFLPPHRLLRSLRPCLVVSLFSHDQDRTHRAIDDCSGDRAQVVIRQIRPMRADEYQIGVNIACEVEGLLVGVSQTHDRF